MPLPSPAALTSSITTSLVARGVGGVVVPGGYNPWLLMVQHAVEALQGKITAAFQAGVWYPGTTTSPPTPSVLTTTPGVFQPAVETIAMTVARGASSGAPSARARSYAAEAGLNGPYGAALPEAVGEGCIRAWGVAGMLVPVDGVFATAATAAPASTPVSVIFPPTWSPDAAAIVSARWNSDPRLYSPNPAGRASTAMMLSKVVLDSITWLRPTVLVGTVGGTVVPATVSPGTSIV
jgi:hypothetical protein